MIWTDGQWRTSDDSAIKEVGSSNSAVPLFVVLDIDFLEVSTFSMKLYDFQSIWSPEIKVELSSCPLVLFFLQIMLVSLCLYSKKSLYLPATGKYNRWQQVFVCLQQAVCGTCFTWSNAKAVELSHLLSLSCNYFGFI